MISASAASLLSLCHFSKESISNKSFINGGIASIILLVRIAALPLNTIVSPSSFQPFSSFSTLTHHLRLDFATRYIVFSFSIFLTVPSPKIPPNNVKRMVFSSFVLRTASFNEQYCVVCNHIVNVIFVLFKLILCNVMCIEPGYNRDHINHCQGCVLAIYG